MNEIVFIIRNSFLNHMYKETLEIFDKYKQYIYDNKHNSTFAVILYMYL